MDIGLIKSVGEYATFGIKPDLTVFLDLPLRQGLRHRRNSKDRIERRSLSYHGRVLNGYHKMARLEPGRIKIVKVDKDKDKTQSRIRGLADKLLK